MSGDIGTLNTNSLPNLAPGIVDHAPTFSLNLGTPSSSPYVDIVADVLSMLEGKTDRVDATPMLKLATQAIEYELADRLLMEDERARANATH